jgi:hypothetical protein
MLRRSSLALALLLTLSACLLAQAPAKPADDGKAKPADDGKAKPADAPMLEKQAPPANPLTFFKGNRLAADELVEKDVREFAKMVRGADDPPVPPERRKELFDKVLRFLIYRLTWDDLHEGREKLTTRDLLEGSRTGTMDGIYKTFPPETYNRPAEDTDEQAKRLRQQKYMVELRAAASPYLREVLKNRLLVARLNAAIVLYRFAEFGQEDTVDDFLVILDNPNEHDAVKHWAIKGLGELFAAAAAKAPKDPKRMERAALAVYKWLDDHTKTPPAVMADLSPPEQDGIRFVRKEAIHALGNYRRPLIVNDEKNNRREGPVAELLLKLMNNEENALAPAANLPEQKEAAVALLYLQSKGTPTYQPDFVAYQVARFIALLGAEASRDPNRMTQRWQAYAAHLRSGGEAFTADTKGNAYVAKIVDRCGPVLENLYDGSKFTTAVGDLNETLNNSQPKVAAVFADPAAKKPTP